MLENNFQENSLVWKNSKFLTALLKAKLSPESEYLEINIENPDFLREIMNISNNISSIKDEDHSNEYKDKLLILFERIVESGLALIIKGQNLSHYENGLLFQEYVIHTTLTMYPNLNLLDYIGDGNDLAKMQYFMHNQTEAVYHNLFNNLVNSIDNRESLTEVQQEKYNQIFKTIYDYKTYGENGTISSNAIGSLVKKESASRKLNDLMLQNLSSDLKVFIKSGANPNAFNKDKKHILISLIEEIKADPDLAYTYIANIEALLEEGANPNYVSDISLILEDISEDIQYRILKSFTLHGYVFDKVSDIENMIRLGFRYKDIGFIHKLSSSNYISNDFINKIQISVKLDNDIKSGRIFENLNRVDKNEQYQNAKKHFSEEDINIILLAPKLLEDAINDLDYLNEIKNTNIYNQNICHYLSILDFRAAKFRIMTEGIISWITQLNNAFQEKSLKTQDNFNLTPIDYMVMAAQFWGYKLSKDDERFLSRRYNISTDQTISLLDHIVDNNLIEMLLILLYVHPEPKKFIEDNKDKLGNIFNSCSNQNEQHSFSHKLLYNKLVELELFEKLTINEVNVDREEVKYSAIPQILYGYAENFKNRDIANILYDEEGNIDYAIVGKHNWNKESLNLDDENLDLDDEDFNTLINNAIDSFQEQLQNEINRENQDNESQNEINSEKNSIDLATENQDNKATPKEEVIQKDNKKKKYYVFDFKGIAVEAGVILLCVALILTGVFCGISPLIYASIGIVPVINCIVNGYYNYYDPEGAIKTGNRAKDFIINNTIIPTRLCGNWVERNKEDTPSQEVFM